VPIEIAGIQETLAQILAACTGLAQVFRLRLHLPLLTLGKVLIPPLPVLQTR